MKDESKTYRIVPKPSEDKKWKPRPVTFAEMAQRVYFTEPCAEPGSELTPHGEWYCMNPECTVRQVQIRFKLYGESMPKKLVCPACRKGPLTFHHWLRDRAMAPVKDQES